MEQRKAAAERIRPILEAMERSINSARRKRTHGDGPGGASDEMPQTSPSAQAGPPANEAPQGAPGQPAPQQDGREDDPLRTKTGERLKARPKRPQNLLSSHLQQRPPYSRAG